MSQTITHSVPGWALSNRLLHLVLLPTERCNFRCTYCYEDFRLSRMRPEVVSGVKRLLDARFPALERLDVAWFGGEPLAAAEVVSEVMEHVQRLHRASPHVRVEGEMTTNADLLTYAMATSLISLGVRTYQITLDGVKADHDAVRKRANGTGTFDSVWKNLTDLKRHPEHLTILVRIHVTEANHVALPELLRICAKELGGDPRFRFHIRPLARLGGPNDATLPILDSQKAPGVVAALRQKALELGLLPPPSACDVCYAARANSWVIRANGGVNKCTVALSDPRNRVGYLNPDGTLTIDGARTAVWLRGLATNSPEDLTCPWKGMRQEKLVTITKSAA